MILKVVFCLNTVVAFTPPAPILPTTSSFNDIINEHFH